MFSSLSRRTVTMIVFIALALPSSMSATAQEPMQETMQGEIKSVHLNMAENEKVTPELPDELASEQSVNVPCGWVPAWWSVTGRFGHAEWRTVGTWVSENLGSSMKVTGSAEFNIWVTFEGDGTPSASDFEFTVQSNGNPISDAVVIEDVPLEEGMEPYEITASANINETELGSGDTLELYIRARVSLEGAKILFWSSEHLSGMSIDCNPIAIINIDGCEKGVLAELIDAFRVNWNSENNKKNIIAFLDGQVINVEPEIKGNKFHWEKGIGKGTHTVTVLISYDGNTTWEGSSTFDVKEEEKGILENLAGFESVLIAISALIIIVLRRRDFAKV